MDQQEARAPLDAERKDTAVDNLSSPKPMAGARCVAVEPGQAAVFEDALAGVAAGRSGGPVVGVGQTGHADALRAHGADIVVSDLAQLLGGARGEAGR